MRKLVSFFLKFKIYNNIHKVLGFKIFKLFKIFFVETNFEKLPVLNHPLEIDYKKELKKYNLVKKTKLRPFVSYSHILDIIKLSGQFKKREIKFLDFGAGNLELFAYLSKNMSKLKYFYHDQNEYNLLIEKIKNDKKIKKLEVIKNFKNKFLNFDFVYFGALYNI